MKIVKKDNDITFPFDDEQGRCYTPIGRYGTLSRSNHDLVRLLPEGPTARLAELEAKRAELDKEIEELKELKKNTQTVYCAAYIHGTSQVKLAVCAYESYKKRQEVIDTWDSDVSPIINTFDLPFRKVDGKWEPAFEIVPK